MVRGLGDRTVLYPDKLMRVRVHGHSVLPGYVETFFQAPRTHERLIAKAKSSAGQNGVSGSDLKIQPFAYPPFAEQKEILRRIDQLLSLADQIEARYEKAKGYFDSLKQSILARAFRGELVPQDPKDEPATVLLERIREARAVQQSRPSVKRTKKPLSPRAKEAHTNPN
jgi:type I restriction enzyme S subunit